MIYWIWLTKIPGIGPVMQKELLRVFKTPESVFDASSVELLKCTGLGKEKLKLIEKARSNHRILESSKRIVKDLEKHNIKLLTYYDNLYPSMAKEISDSPVLLYYKGHIRKESMGVAIVGARRCSSYGKRVVVDAASHLAKHGIPVISGMAKGIDSYAHTVCVKESGYTIAFLGNGLDKVYPSEHTSLMEEIIDNGAVISEYEPGVSPKKEHFPKRNRLISGWANKLLVVEAGVKSGALITAELAKKYGRQVYVVPGEIYSVESAGCNNLIAQGAEVFLCVDQLFMDDRDNRELAENRQMGSSEYIDSLKELDKKILQVLGKYQEIGIGELCGIIGSNDEEILERLVMLEIGGRVVVRGDKARLRE